MADISPKYSSPKSFIDSAPTPAEPMVCGSNNIVVFLTIQYYCLSLRHE